MNGKCNGMGICKWNSGDRYEGQWENDSRKGMGTIYYNDGSKAIGYW